MSIFKTIKEHLLQDTEKIEKLLMEIGCEYISYEQRGSLITCRLPFDKFGSGNTRAVQVKLNNSLSSTIRNIPDFESSDIFDLISYVHFGKRGEEIKKHLKKTMDFVCQICGLEHLLKKKYKEKSTDLHWLMDIKKQRVKEQTKEIVPNEVIPESVLCDFKNYPSYDWVKEGISYEIQQMYEVRVCLSTYRFVFPIRDRHGNLIGVKGRLMLEEDEKDESKYKYLYKCNVSQELFNFHFAQPYILAEKKVIIVEGEKSCMKFASYGIWNTVALSSSDISPIQADIIRKLGIDIEIYLAFDKDVSEEMVKKQARKFKGRKVYGIFDRNDLLAKKNAPIDKGLEVWRELFEHHSVLLES